MRALYRTRFQLRDPDESPQAQFDAVAATCFNWVVERQQVERPSNTPGAAEAFEPMEIGQRHELEACRVDREGNTHWGLHYMHQDRSYKGQWWSTQLGLFREGNGPNHFSCSLLLGRRDGQVSPVQQLPGRPRIVRDILKEFGGGGRFPLLTKAVQVGDSEEEVEHLLQLLEYPERTHPIVFVSRTNGGEKCLISPVALADRVCGIAHLIVASNSFVSRRLEGLMGKKHACYGGAIRIYWPQFQRNHSPNRHPLFPPDKILKLERFRKNLFQDKLLARLADVASFNTTEPFITWPRLQELRRRQAMEEAKDRGELSSLVELQDEEIKGLQNQLQNQRHVLEDTQLENLELLDKVDNYQRAIQGAGIVVEKEVEELPPADVDEAIQKAKKKFKNQLAFAWNSKSEEKHYPYQKPEEVLSLFEWLATTYYDAKIGKSLCPNFNTAIRHEMPGWSYSAKQAQATLGKNPEWYEATWKKKSYTIAEHCKKGTGSDPSHCIRIAFAWDEEKRRIVLGFLGQHQRNTKS